MIEVNQGQRAFDVADAGAQVAKQQVLGDKEPGHYDVEEATLCNTDVRDPDDAIDTANDILRNPLGENWAPGFGQTKSFAGGEFTVTIQWLNSDPTAPPGCIAPETGTPPPGTDYFRVISTGKYGNATRRVEAIYETYDLNVPRAYYTPGKIKVAGSACIDSVSLFSASTELDAVRFDGGGSCKDDAGNNIGHLKGPDLAYGDWNDPPSDQFNTTARTGSTCNRTLPDGTSVTKTCAGVAAVGGVSSKRAGLDYDKDTNPKFVADPDAVGLSGQQTDEITYPFDVAAQPDPVQLCNEAQAQGNYKTESGTGLVNLTDWPANSSHTTVVCFNFTNPASNNELRWAVGGDTTISGGSFDGCKEPRKRGTLVVRGGAFSVKPKTALFQGVVVVRGPADQESTVSNTDDAGLSGNSCLDGFINSTGTINITGTVSPSGSAEVNNRPGFYGVRTWGWRELYE